MIRLLTLVQKAEGRAPNQRFRHEQWAPWLREEHGIRLEFAPFEDAALSDVLYGGGSVARKARLVLAAARRRLALARDLPDVDGVVVLREAMLVGPPIVERRIVRAGLPLLFDFDDTIWRWGPGANGLFSLARMPWKVGAICRMATAVTVGNEFLAAYARRFNPHTYLVPTSISETQCRELPRPEDESPFRIVWTGSHSTLAHLEELRPALERLAEERPVVLRVVCDRPPAPFARVRLEFVPWSPAVETEALGASHVGVMPLPDSELTRGKCGCKALQYMAVRRAAVVSPVGINREIIRHGENGMWASTTEEWVTVLRTLADDPALRARLADAGRATVEAAFTARRAAAAFATVVRAHVPPRRQQEDRAPAMASGGPSR